MNNSDKKKTRGICFDSLPHTILQSSTMDSLLSMTKASLELKQDDDDDALGVEGTELR